MYYRRDVGLLYLAHPRTASRATRDALLEQADFEQPEEGGDRRKDVPHHITAEEVLQKTDIDPNGFTVFTTVRNHWDTCLSWYYHLHSGVGFEPEWLGVFEDKNSQYLPVEGRLWELHRPAADVILRFESIERDLNDLLWANGVDPVELPRVGVTGERAGRHHSEYYDAEMKEAVGSYFSQEIKELGYEFDG